MENFVNLKVGCRMMGVSKTKVQFTELFLKLETDNCYIMNTEVSS